MAFVLRTLPTLPRRLNLSFKIHVSAAELRRRGFPGHETPPPTCPQEKPRCLGHGHPHLRLRPCCQQVRDGGRSLSSSGSPAPRTGPGGGGGFTLRASPTHTSLHSRRSPLPHDENPRLRLLSDLPVTTRLVTGPLTPNSVSRGPGASRVPCLSAELRPGPRSGARCAPRVTGTRQPQAPGSQPEGPLGLAVAGDARSCGLRVYSSLPFGPLVS